MNAHARSPRRAPLATLLAVAALALLTTGTPHAAGTEDAAAETAANGEGAGEVVAEGAPASDAEPAPVDDFPTTAVVDYVLGCMVANGNTHEALTQCSCSIDFIKARMNYVDYEQAGTVLQVQRDVGQRGIFYRDSNWAKRRVERLEALQAESTLRCF